MHFSFLVVNFNYFLLINITVPVVSHLSGLSQKTEYKKTFSGIELMNALICGVYLMNIYAFS